MKTIKLESGTVTVYASIKELPIKQYSAYQKWLLFDAGVGSDIEAITRHFEKLHQYLAKGKTKEALDEAVNLHFNFYYQLSEASFKGMGFACLVHSVNGERVTDFGEENMKQLLEKLSDMGLTRQVLETELEITGKKFERELRAYFPGYFSEEVLINLMAQVQKKNALMLEYLVSENDALLPRIGEIEDYILSATPPENFDLNKPDNAIYRHESGFENLCASLEDMGAQNAIGLTVFSFYHKCKFYDKKHSPEK